jgi:altronate dehydratase large subunit
MTQFMGYRRVDGTVGVRNHVVVMSSVSCANGVVEAIGRAVPGVVPITHTEGCGRGPDDVTLAIRTLVGTARHPNVSAALVVGLGCEVIQAAMVAERAAEGGRRVEHLVIQETGGTPRSVDAGVALVREMLAEAAAQQREPAGVEQLMLALECGGSDSMSGLTANPAVGLVSDWLVGAGGTVILSEITEFIGAEDAVAARCATPEVRDRLMGLLADQRELVKRELGPFAHLVIAPGNAEGGLSSIEEKSLGSFAKGGHTPIRQVVEYAETPTERGLVVMDAPGSDVFSFTGELAAGAQVMLFTTGRGTPTGSPIAPTVKISTNHALFERMPDDMDFDAGSVVHGRSLAEVADDLRELVVEVADGAETCAERNRSAMFAITSSGPPF